MPGAFAKREARRWWTYQRERFPVVRYGVLTAVFAGAAVSYSSRLRRGRTLFPLEEWLAASAVVFLLFLQMRIADDFKDRENDARYRGYRPVPRGLVKVRELGAAGAGAALAQLALLLWLDPALIPILLAVWGYLALMTVEFFAGAWLRAHPGAYLGTHMVLIPLITVFATAFDWRAARAPLPPALLWLAATTFFVCLGLEIGRKTRAAPDEEPGVETYSFLWGRTRAAAVWVSALVAACASACGAARSIGAADTVAPVAAVLAGAAIALAMQFAANPARGRGRWLERYSELSALALLGCLGPVQSAADLIRS